MSLNLCAWTVQDVVASSYLREWSGPEGVSLDGFMQGKVMLRIDTELTAGGPRPRQRPWDHVIVLSDQREHTVDRIKRTFYDRGQAAWRD